MIGSGVGVGSARAWVPLATEAEAGESEDKGNLLIFPNPIVTPFVLFTLERKSPYASDSAFYYVTSGNQI